LKGRHDGRGNNANAHSIYAKAIKLIKLLGFAVEQPQPVGLGGALFAVFTSASMREA
jgi:hypothetical protein